jgi:hypothetical protein
MAQINSKTVMFNGLGTLTINISTAGNYTFSGKISLPTLGTGATANSQVVTTIKQNGTTRYTGTAGAEGFYLSPLTCAANDAITIIFSSSAAVDQQSNSIQATVTQALGQ